MVATARAELYGLPPEEFTARRNELARALKQDGRRDTATSVLALRKPPVHLWAVNRLARKRPLALTRLLSSADNLGEAQERALAGEAGAGARLRQDSGEYQRALDLAVREALEELRAAGGRTVDETGRQIRGILAAALLGTSQVRQDLTAGSLAEVPVAAGAEAYGFGREAPLSTPPSSPPAAHTPAPRRPAREPAAARPGASPAGRRAHHQEVLQARRAAETEAANLKRLVEVARRARRRAAIAAAAAASAETEAVEAESQQAAASARAAEAEARYRAFNPAD